MLADDLLSSDYMRYCAGQQFSSLDAYIHEAHRFDLSPRFTAAAATIAWQNDDALARGLPVCRLPYESAWIELPTNAIGDLMPPGTGVDRIGFLLHHRRDDLSAYDAHMFFRMGGGVMPSGVSLIIDTGSGSAVARYTTSTNNDIDSRIVVYPCPFNKVAIDDLKTSKSAKISAEEYLSRSVGDWGGGRMLLAILALINSKNTATITAGRDQKKRRRGGKKPLLSYSICDIDLRRRGSHASGGHCDTRAHFVRGHFKVRATGVYWWSPFIRGEKALGFVSKSYRVVGDK